MTKQPRPAAGGPGGGEDGFDALDALALEVDVAQRMPIRHPGTQQPLVDAAGEEAWIELLSQDSDAGRAQQRKNRARSIALRGNASNDEMVALAEQEIQDSLVALTTGWHLVGFDGQPIALDCTPANRRRLYAHPKFGWIRDQALVFVQDRGNFVRASRQG